ncbi:hypothetical protein [Lutimonas sp.]|uniref:hypothetical protein n=1 Tax=Lutimonas sp. TaxID=1872403 RepID=UPI003D9B052F
MKKIRLLFAFLVMLFCFVQCTEDDVVEKAEIQKILADGGEEGEDDKDSTKD